MYASRTHQIHRDMISLEIRNTKRRAHKLRAVSQQWWRRAVPPNVNKMKWKTILNRPVARVHLIDKNVFKSLKIERRGRDASAAYGWPFYGQLPPIHRQFY